MPVQDAMARGRGRPRDAEKDMAIRDAAWSILADKGYEGLTFEGIAEGARCSRATLYRRFPSKIALIAAILDETSRAVEPDLEPDAAPRDALVAHTTACSIYMSGDRGPAIISLGVSARQIPDLIATVLDFADQERAYYRREFLRLCPEASFEDLEFASETLIGGVVYHVAIMQKALSPVRIGQLVDQAIALLSG